MMNVAEAVAAVVTITGPRGEEWLRICGTRTFPVMSVTPVAALLPGLGPTEVFLLNLRATPPATLERIVSHLAAKFGMAEAEALDHAHAAGIPILAQDTYVVFDGPDRWVSGKV